jgi:hypothetical protein
MRTSEVFILEKETLSHWGREMLLGGKYDKETEKNGKDRDKGKIEVKR